MSGFNLVQTATGGSAFVDGASSSVGLNLLCLRPTVNRAPTNTMIIGTVPANANITGITVSVAIVSNAATTATVSIGLSGGSATYFSAAQDVKTALGHFAQAPTANWVPLAASQILTATYTETGGASTAGSIYVTISYCVP